PVRPSSPEERLRLVDDGPVGRTREQRVDRRPQDSEVVDNEHQLAGGRPQLAHGKKRFVDGVVLERRRGCRQRLQHGIADIEGQQYALRPPLAQDEVPAAASVGERGGAGMIRPGVGSPRGLERQEPADRDHESRYLVSSSRACPDELNIRRSITDSDGTNAPPNCAYAISPLQTKCSRMPCARNASREYSSR